MIVYVESNFILEIALEQKESKEARAILSLAEIGKIQLSFPDFALSEPFTSILQLKSQRESFNASSQITLKQLKQSELSEMHNQVISALPPVMNLLTQLWIRELDILHSTVELMLEVGQSIQTNAANFKQALMYQGQLGLQPKDSIIYSSVIADLRRQTNEIDKCFLNRNIKDFNDPDIITELRSFNCHYVGSFTQGLNYLQHKLRDEEA